MRERQTVGGFASARGCGASRDDSLRFDDSVSGLTPSPFAGQATPLEDAKAGTRAVRDLIAIVLLSALALGRAAWAGTECSSAGCATVFNYKWQGALYIPGVARKIKIRMRQEFPPHDDSGISLTSGTFVCQSAGGTNCPGARGSVMFGYVQQGNVFPWIQVNLPLHVFSNARINVPFPDQSTCQLDGIYSVFPSYRYADIAGQYTCKSPGGTDTESGTFALQRLLPGAVIPKVERQ